MNLYGISDSTKTAQSFSNLGMDLCKVYLHKFKQPLKNHSNLSEPLHKHKLPNLELSKYVIGVLCSLSYLFYWAPSGAE